MHQPDTHPLKRIKLISGKNRGKVSVVSSMRLKQPIHRMKKGTNLIDEHMHRYII